MSNPLSCCIGAKAKTMLAWSTIWLHPLSYACTVSMPCFMWRNKVHRQACWLHFVQQQHGDHHRWTAMLLGRSKHTCMSSTGDRDSSSSMSTRLVRGRGSKKTGAKPSSVCMISAELDSTVSSSSPILCRSQRTPQAAEIISGKCTPFDMSAQDKDGMYAKAQQQQQ